VDAHTVEVTGSDGVKTRYTGEKILIATGGRPHFPPGEGIEQNCISSDGFFEMEELPKVAIVVGAGYIAVELAGVLNSLGTEVHLVVRKGKALREFDPMISDGLDAEMLKTGIMIHRNTNGVAKVVKDQNGKKNVTLHSGDVIYGADVVLMAAGRVPNTEDL
jgi:glutathione reductase (NADPH)